MAVLLKTFFSISNDKFKDTIFLTGLRAYAAFAVFFIHMGGFGLRSVEIETEFFNRIVDFGKYGVVIFFVLSAYTIAFSLDLQPVVSWKKYFIHRFVRVIPMYYLAVIIGFFFGGADYYFKIFNVTNTYYNLFAHLSFVNIFQVEYRNNLIGTEWSVPIEVAYYLIIPVLVICFKKIKNFGVHLFIISLLWAFVSPFLYKGNGTKFDELVFNWTIARYFLSFSMGLIVFYFQKKLKNNMPQFNSVVLIELFTLLLIFIYINIPFQLEFMTFWACAIILVASARSKLSRIMFENKFIIWFGTISYSFYLIHYPMIEVMKYWLIDEPIVQFGSVFGATFVLSYITYVFIERPFINLGRKLLA